MSVMLPIHVAAMQKRGHNDGVAAASWLVDGNTKNPEAVLGRLIKGIEDGDPEIMDNLPSPRLGGEFADDPTWANVLREETEIVDDGVAGDLLYEEYITAFSDGVENEIRRMHRAYSDAEPEIGKENPTDGSST